MKLSMEWRIPWEADWPQDKKIKAAEKIIDYINRGTLFEERSRMRVADAQVVARNVTSPDGKASTPEDPYILFTLEN